MDYTPDNWVVVKVHTDLHKVVAGWSGGYLDGDHWRVNSGIVSIEEDDDYLYFVGSSGSVYKCHKDSEHTRMNMQGILNKMIDMGCIEIEAKDLPFEVTTRK